MPRPFEARTDGEHARPGLAGDGEALRRELERLRLLASCDRGLLEAVLNHSPQGVIACDAQGRLVLHNRAAERIWAGSASAEGFAEWARYRAFHPDGRPYGSGDWSMARAIHTGEVTTAEEVHFQRFDGTHGVLLGIAAPIFGPDEEIAGGLSIFADITAFKDRERELRERERQAIGRLGRLQMLTASLSGAVGLADVARAGLEHAQAVLGAFHGGLWVLRGSVAELVHEIGFSASSRERFQRVALDDDVPLATALRDGEPVFLRSRAELVAAYPGLAPSIPEGSGVAVACLPLAVHGAPVGAMSFTFAAERELADDAAFLAVLTRHCAQAIERARLYDAEQRARAEAVAAQERIAFLYEASTIFASSLDHAETLASVARLAVPRVADWCSVDLAEDLARRKPPAVVAHKDPAKVELARELGRRYPPDPHAPTGAPAVVRTGLAELYEEIPDELLVRVTRDAEHLRIARALGLTSAMVAPMIARGRTLGAISFFSAESGRRYSAADLEMAEQRARRAALAIDNARLFEAAQQAARAREEVVAVVSHDLKNPLNAILMSAGLLQRSANDPARVVHHAQAIHRSVLSMGSLVRGLLDLARLEAGRFVLSRAPHALGPLIADALAVLQPIAAEKRVALEIAVADVAGARASCDRERLLQVLSNLVGNAIAFAPRGGRVAVRAARSGCDLVVAVADDGTGIAPEDQPHVFERFWSARGPRQGSGTGLGLSIAKGVVEAHGGRIWVESRPGEGATFFFTVPAAPEDEGH
jgi:PAS domain S-box-containing protein